VDQLLLRSILVITKFQLALCFHLREPFLEMRIFLYKALLQTVPFILVLPQRLGELSDLIVQISDFVL
jgi:hypothetical protein